MRGQIIVNMPTHVSVFVAKIDGHKIEKDIIMMSMTYCAIYDNSKFDVANVIHVLVSEGNYRDCKLP